MKFQSDKKELWRYASKNLQTPASGTITTRQSPLQHRLPHQHLPHHQHHQQQQQVLRDRLIITASNPYPHTHVHAMNNISLAENSNSMGRSISTPPPPYSSQPDVNTYAQIMRDRCVRSCRQDGETGEEGNNSSASSNSLAAHESNMTCSRMLLRGNKKGGYSIVNTGDIMCEDDDDADNNDDYVKLNEMSNSSCSSTYLPVSEVCRKKCRPHRKTSLIATSPPPSPPTTATASFAATAAKILRNCCGGGFGGSICGENNNNTNSSHNNNNNSTCTLITTTKTMEPLRTSSSAVISQQPEQYFTALMKHLKASQITLLLKAVKMRQDPLQLVHQTATAASRNPATHAVLQTNCILIRRALIMGEEPHMIACCLFFWGDLQNITELKRLPVCPSDSDPVYVCCNPLHWFRIMTTGENLRDEGNAATLITNLNQSLNYNNGNDVGDSDDNSSNNNNNNNNNKSIFHLIENNSERYVQIPATLTMNATTFTAADGEVSYGSLKWCEIAYWELTQRVGERYAAHCSTVQIYSELPQTSEQQLKTGMCLKDLFETRKTPASDIVQHARQKIGLGVTLSEETDGVWLYNRSMVPIFIYSPTLIESQFRVCRVEPGDCIRAFDKYRAQHLRYPTHIPGIQPGPFDVFSMRISFGKGWGYSYKRLDITCCPCWLEVLFTAGGR